MITATLPALPTSAQLAQGGGRLLYRQRDPNETESMFFPVGCLPDQDTSVQVMLPPSCDILSASCLLRAWWSTYIEQALHLHAGKAHKPK